MRNVFEDLDEMEVRDLYQDAIFKLTRVSSQKNLHSLSQEDIQFLVNAEERGDIKLSGFDETIINSIEEFKIDLDELFIHFKANPSLIKEITADLSAGDIDEQENADTKTDSEIMTQKNIYDEAIKKTIEDLITKKNMSLGNKYIKKIESLRKLNMSITVFFFLLIGFITISFLMDLTKFNTPWEIESIYGEHTITGEDENTFLSEGNILRTDTNTLLSINVEAFGKFTVHGQADFKLERGYESNNIIHFDGDHLEFSSLKKPFIFEKFAKEPALTIILPTGSLKLEVSDLVLNNNLHYLELYVNDGWVEFQNNRNNLFIGKGYSLDLTNKLAVPFYRGTSDAVRRVANEPSLLSLKLESMLSATEEHDILNLWHLLSLAGKIERYKLVEKLAEFTPIFDISTMEGIVALNKDDSAFLLDSIKWILIEGLN